MSCTCTFLYVVNRVRCILQPLLKRKFRFFLSLVHFYMIQYPLNYIPFIFYSLATMNTYLSFNYAGVYSDGVCETIFINAVWIPHKNTVTATVHHLLNTFRFYFEKEINHKICFISRLTVILWKGLSLTLCWVTPWGYRALCDLQFQSFYFLLINSLFLMRDVFKIGKGTFNIYRKILKRWWHNST